MPGTVDWAPVAAVLYAAVAGVWVAIMTGALIWRRSRWEQAMIRLSRRMGRRSR